MKNTVFVFIITFCCSSVWASFEPYIKYGTIDFQEKNHRTATAHKAMMGVGFNLIWQGEIEKILNAELWTMGEPVDEDIQIVHDGLVFSGRIKWKYLFAGLGAEVWRRNSDHKRGFYGDIYFADIFGGFRGEYKDLYLEAGPFLPILSDCDNGCSPDGKLGFISALGLEIKRTTFEIFYTQKKFDDFKLEQYGLGVKYRF